MEIKKSGEEKLDKKHDNKDYRDTLTKMCLMKTKKLAGNDKNSHSTHHDSFRF